MDRDEALDVQAGAARSQSEQAAPQARRPIQDSAVAGYARARPVEQTAFLMASTFSLTIAASRTLNYIREQRRPAPRLRHAGRVVLQLPNDNSVRVHHFLPGMGLSLVTGAWALIAGQGAVFRVLSVPFATGAALTTDELRLLAGRNNPYWGGEAFALAQSAVAAIVAAALAGRFIHAGRSVVTDVPAPRSTA